MKARENSLKRDVLEAKLSLLQGLLEGGDAEGILRLLAELAPEYSPAKDSVDWGSGGATPVPVTSREFGSSLPG